MENILLKSENKDNAGNGESSRENGEIYSYNVPSDIMINLRIF